MSQETVETRPTVLNAFTRHPASVGETYWGHARFALRFSRRLFVASVAALIHALVPSWCETTASREIKALHDEITHRAQG